MSEHASIAFFNAEPALLQQILAVPDHRQLDGLRRHAFLSGLTESQLATLAGLAHEVRFEQDEVILSEQHSRYLYLLVSGSVRIEIVSQFRSIGIQSLGPGEAFGWSSLGDGVDTIFQIRARETCRAICLDRLRLNTALEDDPELSAEMLRRTLELAVGRVLATEARLAEICGLSTPKRRQ